LLYTKKKGGAQMSQSPENHAHLAFLLDFYGELLTDTQRNIANLYYNEDLSLSEVADLCGMTRQGVREHLVKAQKSLLSYESKLHLMERFESQQACLSQLIARLEAVVTPQDQDLLTKAKALLETESK
jgi:predicted DNA-binding protein YlxM (UPF0122 family)